ncbi:MAG: hypothetical protein ACRC4W_04975 [Treponemataceae bacterium]
MYAKFKLNVDFKKEDFFANRDTEKKNYFKQLNAHKGVISEALDKLLENNTLDGSKLEENWFPQVPADVFISHSHKDEENAKILAQWLYDTFNIKAFLDSHIWGNCDDLLSKIDNKFCLTDDNQFYDYFKRNQSTAHVHMMLSIALNKMIDNTECLLFLNTPNSIENMITNKTSSAWIYAEVTMSNFIRKKQLSRSRPLYSTESNFNAMTENINYNLELSDFIDININDLRKWKEAYQSEKYPLDVLYKIIQ